MTVSRKRQAVAATRRHECNIVALPQPFKQAPQQGARASQHCAARLVFFKK